MKYTNMYPKANEYGEYVIIRVLAGREFPSPWAYRDKKAAWKYCNEQGFGRKGA